MKPRMSVLIHVLTSATIEQLLTFDPVRPIDRSCLLDDHTHNDQASTITSETGPM